MCYYWNNKTNESQWTKPKILRADEDLELAEDPSLVKPSPRMAATQHRTPRVPRSPEEAARVLQGMFRLFRARSRAVEQAKRVFEKLFDLDTRAFYYWNNNTNSAQWNKPAILRGADDIPVASEEPNLHKPSPRPELLEQEQEQQHGHQEQLEA
eukprot:CAMPEP_0118981600 /NCGR_PEP_ID=MMETSP1173-20130426/30905_1 /TAXON_ID=1034831 /ORGANISM="Rhizochromulina marina cf, Strain CCMP1243" /LENGTH=153 /DNA_ID=CAMNT_0006932033 /DNA_START=69 /DNA_END=530 /DNA_ORIENTATION=+